MRALVTPSRRTSAATRRMLADEIARGNLGWMWDGAGDNPYLGILALADRMIVTGESISMVSEALATGRPVHVLPLEGQGRRHDAFLRRIASVGMISVIEGDDLDWTFAGIPPSIQPARRRRAFAQCFEGSRGERASQFGETGECGKASCSRARQSLVT